MADPPYGISSEWVRPPPRHPEFQGSVPAHAMDRNSGSVPRKKMVETHNRSGHDGVCALGLAGYMADVSGKVAQDRSIAKMSNPTMARFNATPWGEREAAWKTSRATTYHTCPEEPTSFSKIPPFVARRGNHVLYHSAQCLQTACDDVAADRFRQFSAKQAAMKARQRARQEDRQARDLVHGLENWERDHLGPARRNPATMAASASSPSLLAATGSRSFEDTRRRASDSLSGQFCRRAAAY
eukprot:TRINITY_DN25248_c0_g1_i1.p1 TRINITY_DN25248_c0_g1~~TRINITY_DN25248_c0_g1_i1.p1  ORF type:complete len:241 (-),score=18.50 TRINITY_DN25248_c0_g1_i1:311-1033(-)